MEITIDLSQVVSQIRRLTTIDLVRSANRAINRGLISGRKVIIQQLRTGERPFNISYSDLASKLKITSSTVQSLTGIIHLYGKPIVLSYFRPYQITNRTITRIKRARKGEKKFTITTEATKRKEFGGVMLSIFRNKKTLLKHAFIARGKYGNPLVFMRGKYLMNSPRFKVKSPKQIIALATYRHTSMLRKPKTLRKVMESISERCSKELRHEILYRMRAVK